MRVLSILYLYLIFYIIYRPVFRCGCESWCYPGRCSMKYRCLNKNGHLFKIIMLLTVWFLCDLFITTPAYICALLALKSYVYSLEDSLGVCVCVWSFTLSMNQCWYYDHVNLSDRCYHPWYTASVLLLFTNSNQAVKQESCTHAHV